MKSRCSTRASVVPRRRSFLSALAVALVLACLSAGLFATTAFAVPVAPVISGPTDLRFIIHPLGFRGTVSWQPVDTATAYRVYDADTATLIATVTSPGFLVYGLQGVLYSRYVVAVDGAGNTSPPSNTLDIQTVAPIVPEAPASFEVLPSSAFDIQTSAPPASPVTVQVPYDPTEVDGDPNDLKLLHYTGGEWVDITTSVDTERLVVIGVTPSFSVFAVMERLAVVPVTLDTTTTLSGPTSVRRNEILGLTGTISPASAPGSVTIEMSRLVGKRWASEGSVTVSVLDGAYDYEFVPARRGVWRFVAMYAGGVVGSTTYTSSASDVIAVSVK